MECCILRFVTVGVVCPLWSLSSSQFPTRGIQQLAAADQWSCSRLHWFSSSSRQLARIEKIFNWDFAARMFSPEIALLINFEIRTMGSDKSVSSKVPWSSTSQYMSWLPLSTLTVHIFHKVSLQCTEMHFWAFLNLFNQVSRLTWKVLSKHMLW